MTVPSLVLLSGHLIVAAAVGLVLLFVYRWVRERSPLVATLLAVGLLIRAAAGLLLFWISYLDVAWLNHLHTGDGFWLLARDARSYFRIASQATEAGILTISSTEPSPAYLRMLALWMSAVGVSPASGFFLNLVLYVLLGALLAFVCQVKGNWRSDTPCLVALGAFTFSPVLLIHGTQPLKDDLFVFLIVSGSLAALILSTGLVHGIWKERHRHTFVAGLCALLAAAYLMAGIRAYYAFIFWGSVALMLALLALRQPMQRLAGFLPAAAASLLLVWMACVVGAGPYAQNATAPLAAFLPSWLQSVSPREAQAASAEGLDVGRVVIDASHVIHSAREGFERTPGATNITRWASRTPGGRPAVDQTAARRGAPDAAVREEDEEDGAAIPPPGLVSRLTLGLSLIFIPVSLLRTLSLVEFEGGRGLLVITDVDTVFLDASILAIAILLYRRWPAARQNLPYVLLLVSLSVVTAGLMAYVVTNFGTLFRLRLMLAVPLWLLPLAVSGQHLFAGNPRPQARTLQASAA